MEDRAAVGSRLRWLRDRSAFFALVLACGCLLLATGPAKASGYGWGLEAWLAGANAVSPPPENEWAINLGIGAGYVPDFLGSDDYEGTILPLVDIEWRRAYFASTQRGIGAHFIRKGNLRIGGRLTYDRGREPGDNIILNGLEEIDPSVEAGLFLLNYSGAWRFFVDVRRGVTDGHEGTLASGSVALGGRFSERASLVFGGGATRVDGSYAEAYFGVPANQATAQRAFFTPESGFRDVDGYMHLVYNFTRQIYLSLDTRVTLFVGDANDSPLVEQSFQAFTGMMVGYRF